MSEHVSMLIEDDLGINLIKEDDHHKQNEKKKMY